MANSTDQTLEEDHRPGDQNPNPNQSQEWETMARAWLSAFPVAKTVSTTEVETWIDSNYTSLPPDFQSMPRADIIDRLLYIQNYMRHPSQVTETTQADIPHPQFQRTDQWLLVYSWLYSLDKDEPVKSKDISDWLTAKPDIREHLCTGHSRYHLMHYIKKCHLKILKSREKKKGLQQIDKPTSPKVLHNAEVKESAAFPIIPLSTLPKDLSNLHKDSGLYAAKRNDALRKYKILLELEKKLTPLVSKCQSVNK